MDFFHYVFLTGFYGVSESIIAGSSMQPKHVSKSAIEYDSRCRGSNCYRRERGGFEFKRTPSETWKAGEPTGSSYTSIESTPVTTETIEATVASTEAPTQEAQKVSITYVLNTSSKKFHRLSCGSLPIKNRKDIEMNRYEIISKDYVPCKKCNP